MNCPQSFSEEFYLEPNHTFFKSNATLKVSTTTKLPKVVSTTIANRIQVETTTPVPQTSSSTTTKMVPTRVPISSVASTQNVRDKKTLLNRQGCGMRMGLGSRIIGGTGAGVGRFPWFARLAYRNTSETIKLEFIKF